MSAAGTTVAVVIPSRDRRDLLALTLDSLARQSRPPDQVIVVSDGSTDGTEDMVLAKAGSIPNLSLVRTEGIGPGAARNVGWRRTQAEIVAFIDDDCTATSSWIEAIIAPFSDEGTGIVQGRTVPDGPMGPHDKSISVTSEYGLYETCNIAYRRTALEDAGGFDDRFGLRPKSRFRLLHAPHFGEDTHLAWRVKRKGWRSRFSDAALVHHAVFPRTYRQALRYEWGKSLFPYLLREVPEIRELLPAGRYFLRRQSPMAQMVIIGLPLLAMGRRLAGAALVTPYLVWLVRRDSPKTAAEQAGRDLVASAALLVGSVRFRRLLL